MGIEDFFFSDSAPQTLGSLGDADIANLCRASSQLRIACAGCLAERRNAWLVGWPPDHK